MLIVYVLTTPCTLQVGPAMLVLGEDAQKFGLSISLLERLYSLYHEPELENAAKLYCTHLVTNYRCHRHILSLAQQIAYKMPLECKVPDTAAHPDVTFPLRFICSSIDEDEEPTNSNTNRGEVEVALREASCIFMKWPVNGWGKRDLSQLCFLSPSRGQVSCLAYGKENVCTATDISFRSQLPDSQSGHYRHK